MPKEVSQYKEDCSIKRFNEDEPIVISEEQHKKIREILLNSDVKFIEVGKRIINVSDIKEVLAIPRKPQTDIYKETGSNPKYREWVQAGEPENFKEWIKKTN